MAFFRKFFRNNEPEQAPKEVPSAVSNSKPVHPPTQTAEPAEEQTPVSSDSHLSADAHPGHQTHDAEQGDAETPWWASSSPITVPPPPPVQEDQRTRSTAPLPELAEDTPRRSAPQTAVLDDDSSHTGDDSANAVTPLANIRPKQNETRQLNNRQAPEMVRGSSAQGLAFAALRDVGRVRQINQDSVFALLTTLPREDTDTTLGLFVVADGMGGHDGGEVASRLAINSVARHVLTQIVLPALEDAPVEALQQVMIEAVQEANRTIWDHARRVGSDMGTTCTAVLMLGASLYIGHVGDSRAYLLEPGGLRLLTNDHSAVGRLIQLGQLDPSEAREHPMRSQLYRTVGQQPQVQVDFVHQPINNATHLLIGSDGLWGMVNEERMTTVLQSCDWPQDTCRELVALANLAGGEDNISAVVVSFQVAERASA